LEWEIGNGMANGQGKKKPQSTRHTLRVDVK